MPVAVEVAHREGGTEVTAGRAGARLRRRRRVDHSCGSGRGQAGRVPGKSVTLPSCAIEPIVSPGAPTARSARPSAVTSPVACAAPNWSPVAAVPGTPLVDCDHDCAPVPSVAMSQPLINDDGSGAADGPDGRAGHSDGDVGDVVAGDVGDGQARAEAVTGGRGARDAGWSTR